MLSKQSFTESEGESHEDIWGQGVFYRKAANLKSWSQEHAGHVQETARPVLSTAD